MTRDQQLAESLGHLRAALACADAAGEFALAALIAHALHLALDVSRG